MGLEHMEINGAHVDIGHHVAKLLQRARLQAEGHLKNPRTFEVEWLTEHDSGNNGRSREVVIDDGNDLFP